MAKYIVDIPDEYEKSYAQTNSGTLRIPMQVGTLNYNVWVGTGLRVTPYTEPDKEQIENEVAEFWKTVKDMDADSLDKIFGEMNFWAILNSMPYQEAKEKYDAWKKQIRVGDEVELFGRAKGLVYIVGEEMLEGVYSNCDMLLPFCWRKKDCRKTGRHFPEIAELLKKMREE